MEKWLKLKVNSLIATFLMACLFLPSLALAGPGIPFGGQIIMVIPCICSLNLLILEIPIGVTSPVALIYQPLVSVLYAFFDIWKPGTYLLGNYGLLDVCVIYTGHPHHPCLPIMIAPLILMVGTSQ